MCIRYLRNYHTFGSTLGHACSRHILRLHSKMDMQLHLEDTPVQPLSQPSQGVLDHRLLFIPNRALTCLRFAPALLLMSKASSEAVTVNSWSLVSLSIVVIVSSQDFRKAFHRRGILIHSHMLRRCHPLWNASQTLSIAL